MKAHRLTTLLFLSCTASHGVTSFWNAGPTGDPILNGTGWDITGGTVQGSGIGFANLGGNGQLDAGPATGDDWMGVGSSYVQDGTTFFANDAWGNPSADAFYGFNVSQSPAAFDLYLSPDNLNQTTVLFETGGATDGMGIVLDGSTLLFGVSDNGAASSSLLTLDLLDLGAFDPANTSWYQIRGWIDPIGGQIGLSAFDGTGGTISTSGAWTGIDWAGTDGSGFGGDSGILTGGNGGGQLTNALSALPTADFIGQLGKLEYYGGDMALLVAIPEPSRALLLGVGLGTLLLRRRRV